MSIFKEKEAATAEVIGKLALGNPFLPERIQLEQAILGDDFVPGYAVWSVDPSLPGNNPNVVAMGKLAERLLERAQVKALKAVEIGSTERVCYEGLALYVLYYRYEEPFYQKIIQAGSVSRQMEFKNLYDEFLSDYRRFFWFGDRPMLKEAPEELFAFFFQHRRAFHFTFRHIYGSSLPAARLRASVWESIFTHDISRYRTALYERMHELTTLITGPSGTGKELVAQAIGLSRHIPFDADTKKFLEDFRSTFVPLNLCALSPTVIESELFGHKKGAFTGAVADRKGFLEQDKPWFTVFLDELGEIDPGLQLKLLRVLQTREFQRLGENVTRRFEGKIVSATNVNLADEMQAGRFRADLFYRLCSDVIEMPSLYEQLCAQPEELRNLVTLISRRLVDEEHAKTLAEQAIDWLEGRLGCNYTWPGNMRELEQSVRNILVRKEYHPARTSPQSVVNSVPQEKFAEQILQGNLTADQILSRYCTYIYAQEGSYEGSARRLQMDRRTVKSKIDERFLKSLRSAGG